MSRLLGETNLNISEKCFSLAIELELSSEEKDLLRQSYVAFFARCLINTILKRGSGFIVSDSEPDDHVGLSLDSKRFHDLISKRRQSIKRRA